jgi:hypothetical protein
VCFVYSFSVANRELLTVNISTEEATSILGGINKLRGTQNYQDWKFQVRNYLELTGLWKTVNPTVSHDGVAQSVVTNKDRQAKSIICMLIDPICFSNCITPFSGRTPRATLWSILTADRHNDAAPCVQPAHHRSQRKVPTGSHIPRS